jgi:hypothetical protein
VSRDPAPISTIPKLRAFHLHPLSTALLKN